jgi:HD superfamily phosphohydrolase
MVYPDATHTRFSHSLGAMELARRAGIYLERYLNLSKQDVKAIEYAALLHDIGHFPFSHVFEVPYAFFFEKRDHIERDKVHEAHIRLGREIISDENFGIVKVIGKEMAERVCTLIDPESKGGDRVLREIITGNFSVDKLDYLRRDSYHCGTIEYGTVDAERILFSLTKDRYDPSLPVYRDRAVYALEQAILAHFNMYRAVYYHRTVRAAFLLFQDILWRAFEKEIFKDIKWNDPEFWNGFDEHKCYQMLKEDEEIRGRLNLFFMRQLPKMVPSEKLWDINKDRLSITCETSSGRVDAESKILEKLKDKYELDTLLIDSPLLTPYPREPPFPYILPLEGPSYPLDRRANYLLLLAEEWRKERARIYVKSKIRDLHKDENFIKQLNSVILEVIRI